MREVEITQHEPIVMGVDDNMSTPEFLCGDTRLITWIDSGVTPSSISAAVYNGSETLVDSGAMVSSVSNQSSLTGHYYYLHTVPNTPGYYVAETNALISGKTYKDRVVYRAVIRDVN